MVCLPQACSLGLVSVDGFRCLCLPGDSSSQACRERASQGMVREIDSDLFLLQVLLVKSRLLLKSISSVVGVNRKLWQGQVWATLFLNRCESLGGIRITEHAERQTHNVTSLLLHTGNLKLRDQVTYLMSLSKWQIQDSDTSCLSLLGSLREAAIKEGLLEGSFHCLQNMAQK